MGVITQTPTNSLAHKDTDRQSQTVLLGGGEAAVQSEVTKLNWCPTELLLERLCCTSATPTWETFLAQQAQH